MYIKQFTLLIISTWQNQTCDVSEMKTYMRDQKDTEEIVIKRGITDLDMLS